MSQRHTRVDVTMLPTSWYNTHRCTPTSKRDYCVFPYFFPKYNKISERVSSDSDRTLFFVNDKNIGNPY